MNRREAAELESARSALAAATALGWPCVPKPRPVDVAKELEGKPFGTLFVGWWARAWGSEWRVGQGCTSGHSHSNSDTDRTTSQGGGRFYRHKADALIAARWELCERAAKALAEIDRQVAEEIANLGAED